jgi:hypothetical protein
MKFTGDSIITIGSLVQLGVAFFQGLFNPEIATSCPVPLGPYAETCSEPIIYLDGSGDSKSMTAYNLDDLVFPSCRMITVCDSQNDTVTFNYIQYPPHTQYTGVTNNDGALHQNGLDLYQYSGSMVNVYNFMKREQIIAQRQQDALNRGRLLGDIKTSKVALRKT